MFSKMIEPDETYIIGFKLLAEHGWRDQSDVKRVTFLLNNHLEYVASREADQIRHELYRDPNDGRFWETWYFQPQFQADGPASIIHLTQAMAEREYPQVLSQ